MSLRALAICAFVLAPRSAAAHDFRPGALTLIERSPGTFDVTFAPPVDSTGAPAAIEIEFPDPCRRSSAELACGDAGLTGDITLSGLGDRMRVVVLIERLGKERAEWVIDAAAPRVRVGAASPRSAGAWLSIGAEHILFGIDHLAFVVALLLLLGTRLDRRLIATLTAFTAAHSLTLALAVLDVVRLPSGPIEASIAASVVLVAREATHDRPTATRRAPWVVALLFGLIHGLGFAGALSELGLPEDAVGWVLLWFNAGVELGQIAIVIAASALVRAGARWISSQRAKLAAAYLVGGVAACWFIDRTAPIVTAWW